jgi:hypothetical protein
VDPSKEGRQALFDSISSFGISYGEFTMAPGLIAAMEKYIAGRESQWRILML